VKPKNRKARTFAYLLKIGDYLKIGQTYNLSNRIKQYKYLTKTSPKLILVRRFKNRHIAINFEQHMKDNISKLFTKVFGYEYFIYDKKNLEGVSTFLSNTKWPFESAFEVCE